LRASILSFVEKATKERLTGAAIVVAIVGIVVPELLSGPKGGTAAQSAAAPADAGPPLATYDLAMDPAAVPGAVRQQELASAVSAARSEEIAAAVPPPASPADTASDAVTESSESTPVASAVSEPVPSPAKVAPAPAASMATGSWWVQLASLASADGAQRLAAQLRAKGYTIDVTRVRSGGKELHRVRAGPVKDREAALALKARLAAAGQKDGMVTQ
jgi:DedD protein